MIAKKKNRVRFLLFKSDGGFTLTEVLVSLLLVGIGIFAVMETFNRGFFGLGESENHSLALSLTQRKLEEVSFSSITNTAKAVLVDFPEFQQQVVVVSNDGSAPCGSSDILKRIVVSTYWTTPKGEISVSLSTCLVNQV